MHNSLLRRWLPILAFACLTAIVTSGCEIYRVEVHQGQQSVLDEAENLKVGMTRDEVVEIMGTPLLIDKFRDNRWDYLYSVAPGGERAKVKKRVTLFFDDEELVKILVMEGPPESSD